MRHVEERHARLRRGHGRVEGKRGHAPLPQGKREVSQDDAHQDRASIVGRGRRVRPYTDDIRKSAVLRVD